jgi:hypothetical protein
MTPGSVRASQSTTPTRGAEAEMAFTSPAEDDCGRGVISSFVPISLQSG